MNSSFKKVTVFCASSKKTPEIYVNAARKIAHTLLLKNAHVYYGGGAIGLMGVIADEYLENNGTITGVIPEFMVKVEWAHPKVKDMRIVKDMHERKRQLVADTDVVLALPGGTGTLEELMEVISLKRLGKFNKPIIILNTNGFYNPLNEFFHRMVADHFIRKEHLNLWQTICIPEDFWEVANNAENWDEESIHTAGVY